MKKVLFIHHGNNPILLDDFRAIEELLNGDFSAEYCNMRSLTLWRVKEMAIEEYSAVVTSVPYAALHNSGGDKLDAMKEVVKRTQTGKLFLQTADIQLRMNPSLWNGENSNSIRKENPYLLKPVKVLCSFHEDFLSDKLALQRIKGKWLSFLHKDSTVVPIEFTSGLVKFLPELLRTDEEPALFSRKEVGVPIDHFYHGIEKKYLKESLKELGLGSSERDGVWGTVARMFPTVKDYSHGEFNKRALDKWVPLVRSAKHNLVPYEPLKGEYQFTRRMLELAIINPESIKADPRLSSYTRGFFEVEAWGEKAKEVSVELRQIMS